MFAALADGHGIVALAWGLAVNAGVAFDTDYKFLNADIRSADFHEVVGPELIFTGVRNPVPAPDASHLYFFGDRESFRRLDGRALTPRHSWEADDRSWWREAEGVGPGGQLADDEFGDPADFDRYRRGRTCRI